MKASGKWNVLLETVETLLLTPLPSVKYDDMIQPVIVRVIDKIASMNFWWG